MKSTTTYILSVITVLVLISCGDMGSPVSNDSNHLELKERTKYVLNPSTFQRERVAIIESYDVEGNIVALVRYNQEENLSSKIIYFYNNNLRSDTVFQLDDMGELVPTKITATTYNSITGNVESSVESDRSGNTINIIKFVYDDKDNLAQKVEENVKTGKSTTVNYQSTYNNHGQLVSRATYTNDQLVSSQTYQYGNDDESSITITNTLSSGKKTIVQYTTNNTGIILNEVYYNSSYEVIEAYEYVNTYYD